MASSHSSRSSTPATDATTARSPAVPVDGDPSDGGAQQQKERVELRRGPWTVDEDLALVNYITDHGEGRWNTLASAAGLKRTGKSCRLRWLNYLRPDVKRGNFTADEQLLILDLHSRYGSRWSKIAQHLPGRTDNEIKNYWRTRVQKHAKQLNCDANSKSFKDAMRYLWMPQLVDAHRRRLHHADDYHHQAAAAADQDACHYHTGMAGVASSSSDSFAPTTSESYDAAAALLPKKWDPSASCYDEMLVNGGGDCWVPQEMSQQQAGVWPADERQKASQAVNGSGGQFEVDAELSGWVQGFSEGGVTTDENSFWTLEDIWKSQ